MSSNSKSSQITSAVNVNGVYIHLRTICDRFVRSEKPLNRSGPIWTNWENTQKKRITTHHTSLWTESKHHYVVKHTCKRVLTRSWSCKHVFDFFFGGNSPSDSSLFDIFLKIWVRSPIRHWLILLDFKRNSFQSDSEHEPQWCTLTL